MRIGFQIEVPNNALLHVCFRFRGGSLERFEGAEVHHSCWGVHMGLFLSKQVAFVGMVVGCLSTLGVHWGTRALTHRWLWFLLGWFLSFVANPWCLWVSVGGVLVFLSKKLWLVRVARSKSKDLIWEETCSTSAFYVRTGIMRNKVADWVCFRLLKLAT